MQIREFLQIDSSRLNADILVDHLTQDPDLFDEVWNIALEDKDPVSQRASRCIWLFAEKHPYFIEPRLPELVRCLARLKSDAVKRNFLNILSQHQIPESLSAWLFDYCYQIVSATASPIAHQAYAMEILYNISEMEPGLKPELISLLDSRLPDASTGVKTRAKKILGKLYKDLT